MFRAKYVGWIALESLCRQRDPQVPWELIVAEEQGDNTFGRRRVFSYQDRLFERGCVRLTYIALKGWIPLSEKMSLIVGHADCGSEIFCLSGADYYSNDRRLYETTEKFFKDKIYWLVAPKVLKYHIRFPDRILLVDKTMTKRQDDVPGKAIAGWIVREAFATLPSKYKNVDGTVFKKCRGIVGSDFHLTINRSLSWRNNLSVEGAGLLSHERITSFFRKPHRWHTAYSEYRGTLDSIVPSDIAKRIEKLYGLTKNRNTELPNGRNRK